MKEIDTLQYINLEETSNSIAMITLNRPDVKNALNVEMIREFKKVVTMLEKDKEVLSIILRGSENNFVAGADINEMVGMNSTQAYNFATEIKSLHDMIINSSKPFIAAIEGYCLGGGLELALACDIRLVNETTKLGLPEINLGIIPGGGGVQRLLEIVGVSVTSQLVMTGEIIDGEEASRLHLATYTKGDVVDRALEIAESISRKSSFAISSLKRLINERVYRHSITYLKEDVFEFSLLFDYPDSVEGLSAFLQKRPAKFKRDVN